ncbi:hypothetical protein B484DRAFT_448523 [Ochromonadaceae sp. CCMP2298]|nr:hypothetical protein B484DRAFT_448523 [Ochromonadaceae sp. CCMP2298]
MTTRPLDVHAPPTLTITSEYADNSEDISICISADASVDTISSPQGSSKSRSGSFTVQPIEIDHILSRSPTGRHPELTAFSAEANTIVADEIDMLDGFVPYGPYRTQKGDFDNTPDYDEDRDVDEAAEIEAAAAAKAAIAAAENAEAAVDTTVAVVKDSTDSPDRTSEVVVGTEQLTY